MATAPSTGPLTFYPAYTFSSSPTYFAWVKLTAHDILRVLRSRPGFTSSTGNAKSELLFYLNHPIQFVQVFGVVVAYEDYFDKFWSFTVDDGSGDVIECACWKSDGEQAKDGKTKTEKITEEQEEKEAVIKSLDIGTVVQVKGTISTFRDVRQLNIERLSVVHSTNYEVLLMDARTKFHKEILMKPWAVSANRQKRLLRDAEVEKQTVMQRKERVVRLRARAKRLEEREKRHAYKIAKTYEVEEEKRREDAEEARRAALELRESKAPDVVPNDFADLAY